MRVFPGIARFDLFEPAEICRRALCPPHQWIDVTTPTTAGISVGRPLPDCRLGIRGECGRALPERRLGEIWLKGPCASPGYFLDAETTAKHFRRGWHKSFDLGFVDGGELYVLCRQGDLIKIGGASLVPEGTIQRTGSGKKRRNAIADRFLRGEVSTLMPSGLKPGSIPSVEDDAMPV